MRLLGQVMPTVAGCPTAASRAGRLAVLRVPQGRRGDHRRAADVPTGRPKRADRSSQARSRGRDVVDDQRRASLARCGAERSAQVGRPVTAPSPAESATCATTVSTGAVASRRRDPHRRVSRTRWSPSRSRTAGGATARHQHGTASHRALADRLGQQLCQRRGEVTAPPLLVVQQSQPAPRRRRARGLRPAHRRGRGASSARSAGRQGTMPPAVPHATHDRGSARSSSAAANRTRDAACGHRAITALGAWSGRAPAVDSATRRRPAWFRRSRSRRRSG